MVQLIGDFQSPRLFDRRRGSDEGSWRTNAAAGVRSDLDVVWKFGEPGDLQVSAEAVAVGRDASGVDIRKAIEELARHVRAKNVRARRTGLG